MDKVEISEQMAKAIVQYLLKCNVIRVYTKLKHYLTMNPYVTEEMLQMYIREAILEFLNEPEYMKSLRKMKEMILEYEKKKKVK